MKRQNALSCSDASPPTPAQLPDIPAEAKKGVTFKFVKDTAEVLKTALEQ